MIDFVFHCVVKARIVFIQCERLDFTIQQHANLDAFVAMRKCVSCVHTEHISRYAHLCLSDISILSSQNRLTLISIYDSILFATAGVERRCLQNSRAN